MKHPKLRNIYILISFMLLGACSTESPKLDNEFEYKDFIREESGLIEIDTSIASHEISIPPSKQNHNWKSSNFSLMDIPQNLAANINLENPQIKNYKLYRSSNDVAGGKDIVIYKDTILALADNILYAYDLSNPKKLKWKKEIMQKQDHLIGGGIYYDDDKIAVTCGGKEIVLINALNGNQIWAHNLTNLARSAPVIYKNNVFINTIDNTLHCLDLNTGFLKWAVKEAHEKLGFLGSSTPEPFEDTIIMPFSSGKLSSIHINTGQIKWSASLSMGLATQSYVNDIDMAPVIKDGTAYLSSHNGILYAINADIGQLEWANTQAGGQNTLWVAEDYVYTINKHNQLLAIYKVTGTVKWLYDLEPAKKTKKKNLFFDENNTQFNGPTMINGNLYIVASNGALIIVNAKSGKKLKEIKIAKNIHSPVLVANNNIYLLQSSGSLSIIN